MYWPEVVVVLGRAVGVGKHRSVGRSWQSPLNNVNSPSMSREPSWQSLTKLLQTSLHGNLAEGHLLGRKIEQVIRFKNCEQFLSLCCAAWIKLASCWLWCSLVLNSDSLYPASMQLPNNDRFSGWHDWLEAKFTSKHSKATISKTNERSFIIEPFRSSISRTWLLCVSCRQPGTS